MFLLSFSFKSLLKFTFSQFKFSIKVCPFKFVLVNKSVKFTISVSFRLELPLETFENISKLFFLVLSYIFFILFFKLLIVKMLLVIDYLFDMLRNFVIVDIHNRQCPLICICTGTINLNNNI